MQYITVKEASERWGITERRICKLCVEGRIPGAAKFGWSWAIPADAAKPSDARVKKESAEYFNEKKASAIRIDRVWSMPNKNTFDIPPISMLLDEELTDGLWIDPFANKNKYATITNDLNPVFDTDYHLDALDFLKTFDDASVDGVLYDPPFSPRQVSECYNDVGYNVTWDTTKASFWGNHKREISRIVKVGGKVITFGWNSGGIGSKYGFKIDRILMVPHGGWHNDTICTVETKVEDVSPSLIKKESKNVMTKSSKSAVSNDVKLIEMLKSLPADFWDFKESDTREMTHGIHSYPAMMIYPISRNLISLVKRLYDPKCLLDPFCGSGTVLVEGTLAGIATVYGNDINPLANLLSAAKTTAIDITKLTAQISQLKEEVNIAYMPYSAAIANANSYFSDNLGIDLSAKDGWGTDAPLLLSEYLKTCGLNLDIPSFKNLGYWFKPSVIIELQLIKNCIKRIPDIDIQRFIWIAFSESIRLVSNRRNGEFKMFRMPAEKVLKFNPSVRSEFFEILTRNAEKMSAYADALDSAQAHANVSIFSENAAAMESVPNNSVDLLITSPPYGDSRTTVAYGEFSRLSLQWIDLYDLSEKAIMGIDKSLMGGKKYRNGFEYALPSETLRASLEKITAIDIERAGDVYSFYVDLNDIIAECSRKSKAGTYQFWVVGNRTVKNELLLTDKIIEEMASQYGMDYVYTIDRLISNKVMPSQNSPSNVAGEKVTTMCNEHIVVLRKK